MRLVPARGGAHPLSKLLDFGRGKIRERQNCVQDAVVADSAWQTTR
jgi:hypothetical protein